MCGIRRPGGEPCPGPWRFGPRKPSELLGCFPYPGPFHEPWALGPRRGVLMPSAGGLGGPCLLSPGPEPCPVPAPGQRAPRLLEDYSWAFASLPSHQEQDARGVGEPSPLSYGCTLARPEVVLLLSDSLLSRTASWIGKEPLPFIISHLHFLSLGGNRSVLRTGWWRGGDGSPGEGGCVILGPVREKA